MPVPWEIPDDLPSDLVPLAWLIGAWEGVGIGGYPTVEAFRFGQEIVFAHDGRPFLSYQSHTWLLDDEGKQVRPLAAETGFWRPRRDGDAAEWGIEVILSHPTGFAEIYLGRIDGAKIEISTDVVVRTASAKGYTAGHRLYGRVEGDLLWAYDMAAMGQALQPHLSARLKRV